MEGQKLTKIAEYCTRYFEQLIVAAVKLMVFTKISHLPFSVFFGRKRKTIMVTFSPETFIH